MDGLIKYEKAQKLKNFGLPPKHCPKCHKMWRPEPPPIIIIQEGLFGDDRMAQLYIKQCEFCGYTYKYYG